MHRVFKNKLISSMNINCNKWLLKINLRKTKALIFQKQNRKSTRDKYTFFLNGNQIANVTGYSYQGVTFTDSNESFSVFKQSFAEKKTSSIFGAKRYLDFDKLPVAICNKLFDALFLAVLLHSSEVWGAL